MVNKRYPLVLQYLSLEGVNEWPESRGQDSRQGLWCNSFEALALDCVRVDWTAQSIQLEIG
jgi:hypothetical protein